VHDEFDEYHLMHELYGHPHDAELKQMLQHKVVKGAPINIRFPPTPLPCATCLQVNTIASQVPPSTATHRKAEYPGQVLCLDNMGPIGPTGQGYPYINMITDLCTGAAIATNSLENKAQTALAQEVSLHRAHRAAAPRGGTQRLELDMGSDVLTKRTKAFADAQGMLISDFAAGNPRPRGAIERPHQTFKRKLRMLLHSSGLPSEQFHYLIEHARRLFNLTMADNTPTKSKHEAYYRSQPSAKTLLHRFGAQVVIKIWPTPPGLQARGLRGRWYGLAGNSNTVHLVSVQYLTKGGALKHRVVRSRDVRFLDDATEPDDAFDAASVPTAPLAEDDPVLATALDTLGRTLYHGTHADECSDCGAEDSILYSCDYCPLAHCFSCTDATLPQLAGTWRCVTCRAQDAAVPMDRVQDVDEANLFPAWSRTKWGVGADADTDASDVDEQLPAEPPDLDGPLTPGVPDRPWLHPDTQARRRAALLRRSTVAAARLARHDASAPAPTVAAHTAARTARHARRQHQPPALTEPAVTPDDEPADVRPRSDVDQSDTLYDLDDGSSSRCMPVAATRSVAATAAPATHTPPPPLARPHACLRGGAAGA
jgi:hypothetical protein